MSAFARVCSLLETALAGAFRQEIVAGASRAANLGKALLRLRESMHSDAWQTASGSVDLHRDVSALDARTRTDGFHAMHDWDGKADAINKDTIPTDVLNYLVEKRGGESVDRVALAILLDYYFLHILAVLSLRAWDDGHPDEGFDRLDHLLAHLQGPDGSGQRFVDNAGTLVLIATSHFELNEAGFDPLLAKVRTLRAPHRTHVAMSHAAAMGSHLRFGFEATYGRDTAVMRNDNVVDYPWLCFALSTLIDECTRIGVEESPTVQRDLVVEAILNGLSPDARAFVGHHPPTSLSRCDDERAAFRDQFLTHRDSLLKEFERYRPVESSYSPLSFFFNFSHNVLKGIVIDAVLRGDAWALSFNDLLSGVPHEKPEAELKQELAGTLMAYARSSPDRIRGRLMPVIVYDPIAGRQAFSVTMQKLRDP